MASTSPITSQIENHLFYFSESFLAIITVLRLISNTKVTGFKLQNNRSDWWESVVHRESQFNIFFEAFSMFKKFLKKNPIMGFMNLPKKTFLEVKILNSRCL